MRAAGSVVLKINPKLRTFCIEIVQSNPEMKVSADDRYLGSVAPTFSLAYDRLNLIDLIFVFEDKYRMVRLSTLDSDGDKLKTT